MTLAPVAAILLLSPSAVGRNGGSWSAEQPVRIKEIARTTLTSSGGKIELPDGQVETVVTKYRVASRATLPVHKHRYPRFGYILSGSLAIGQPGKGIFRVFKAGEFLAEDIDTWHDARNLETRPAELLVIDLVPPGTNNVIDQP